VAGAHNVQLHSQFVLGGPSLCYRNGSYDSGLHSILPLLLSLPHVSDSISSTPSKYYPAFMVGRVPRA